jgi:tetratricopeptide (TPR) repeat protein
MRRDHQHRQIATLLVGIVTLVAFSVHAADDPVQKALKAYEKHRYEDAGRDLRAALPSLEKSKQASAELALGMVYLKNAELHRELTLASAGVTTDYLGRISQDRGKGRSKYSDLYLGRTALTAGRADAAAVPLERFAADAGTEARYRAIARVSLGTVAAMNRDAGKARDLWSRVNAADPDVRSELAAALSRAGSDDRNPPALCDEALADIRRSGKPVSPIAVKNCLGVYARAGVVEKGIDLLAKADLKAPSYRESLGKSKVLSFYDVDLLENLSAFYLQAGITSLEKAAADQQLKTIAYFYLGEAFALAGNSDRAAKATTAFLGSSQMPPQYRNKALVRQGVIQHQSGKPADAVRTWDELIRSHPDDPELLADILASCGRLRLDCPRAAKTAESAVERGEGRRFMVLNAGLGRYYYGKKDYARAAQYFEAGRDKGNKNKIEFNDALMLVDLADSYYRTKKFSEALEIYFEMSKQFPQVRQVQDALQGIYAMEHKSAGDVKIN